MASSARRSLLPDDIPLGRGVVYGTRVPLTYEEPGPFKPYVYRGTGVDQMGEAEKEKARQELLAEMWREQREKRAARARDRRRVREAERRELLARREAERSARAERLSQERAEAERQRVAEQWVEPEPVAHRVPRSTRRSPAPRPAPGWKPPTGADLDAWLEEIEA